MVHYKCGPDSGTCKDLKLELEIENHKTEESIEQMGIRLKQVELESKKKFDQIQELSCKVLSSLSFL